MKSKTIIISSPDGKTNARGILTLYEEEELLKCRMRTYSIGKLNKYCKLAIYHRKEVFSANLLEKNGVYESSFVGSFDLDLDFYCAIIDTNDNNTPLLAGGTYSGYYFSDTSVFASHEDDQYIDNSSTLSADTEDCDEECDKCTHCKYKEYFYAQNNVEINQNSSENAENIDNSADTQPIINDQNTPDILSAIIPQFEYIFTHYQADEELNTLIQNARFVKINENNEQYSIGAIYEDENLKVICYAIKCNYNTPAPDSLGDHYQWLPIDKDDPLSEGYYVVFQDAKDLKILNL